MEKTVLAAKGMLSNGNPHSRSQGGADLAFNVNVDSPDLWEQRRKFIASAFTFASHGTYALKMFAFQSGLVTHHADGSLNAFTSAGARTGLTAVTAPTGAKVRAAEANKNLYLTTSTGVQVVENVSGTASRAAGEPVATDLISANLTGVGTGWLPKNNQVGYRYCIGRKDSNNNVILGPMSTLTIVANPAPATQTIAIGATSVASSAIMTVTLAAHGYHAGDVLKWTPSSAADDGMLIVGTSGSPISFAAPGEVQILSVPTINTFTLVALGYPTATTNTATASVSSDLSNVVLTLKTIRALVSGEFVQIYRSPMSGSYTIAPLDSLNLIAEVTNVGTGSNAVFTDNVSESFRNGGTPAYTNATEVDGGYTNSHLAPPLCLDLALYQNCMVYANTTSKHRLFVRLIGIGSTGLNVGDTVTIGGRTYTGIVSTTSATSTNFNVFTDATNGVTKNVELTARSLVNAINRDASATVYASYIATGETNDFGRILLEERSIGGAAFAATAGSSTTGSAFVPSLPTAGTAVQSDADVRPNRLYISLLQRPEAVPILNYVDVGARTPIQRIAVLKDSLFIFKSDGIYRMTGTGIENFRLDTFDRTTWIVGPETLGYLGNQLWLLSNQGVVAVSETGVRIMSYAVEDQIKLVASESAAHISTYFAVGYESDRRYILVTSPATTYPSRAYCYNTLTEAWTIWDAFAGASDFATAGLVNPNDDKLYLGSADAGTSTTLAVESKTFSAADFGADTGLGNASVPSPYIAFCPYDGGDASTRKNWKAVSFLFAASVGLSGQNIAVSSTFATDVPSNATISVSSTLSANALGQYSWTVAVPPECSTGAWLSVLFSVQTAGIIWKLAGVSYRFEPLSETTRR